MPVNVGRGRDEDEKFVFEERQQRRLKAMPTGSHTLRFCKAKTRNR